MMTAVPMNEDDVRFLLNELSWETRMESEEHPRLRVQDYRGGYRKGRAGAIQAMLSISLEVIAKKKERSGPPNELVSKGGETKKKLARCKNCGGPEAAHSYSGEPGLASCVCAMPDATPCGCPGFEAKKTVHLLACDEMHRHVPPKCCAPGCPAC